MSKSKRNTTKLKMPKSDDNRCDLCDISYLTPEELREHFWSLMHHIKLEQKKKNCVHRCTLCFASCPNLTEYSKHLNLERHRKAVLEDKKMKMRESDSGGASSRSESRSSTSSVPNLFDRNLTSERDKSFDSPRAHRLQNSCDRPPNRRGGSWERVQPYSFRSYRNQPHASQGMHNRSFSHGNYNSGYHGNRNMNPKGYGSSENNLWNGCNQWNQWPLRQHQHHFTDPQWNEGQSFHSDQPSSNCEFITFDASSEKSSNIDRGNLKSNSDKHKKQEKPISDSKPMSNRNDRQSRIEKRKQPDKTNISVKEKVCEYNSLSTSNVVPETSQRSRSRSPLKKLNKVSDKLDASSPDTHDSGQSLLNKAESLCKELRKKREQAKKERQKRDADVKKLENEKLEEKIQHYTETCYSKIKGYLIDTDYTSASAHDDTVSISHMESTSKENLASHNVSCVTDKSIDTVSTKIISPRVESVRTAKTNISGKLNLTRTKTKEPLSKAQMMKMINSPRSYKERLQLESLLKTRPKPSRPKLNLQPSNASLIENLDVGELPEEIRIKVEKLLEESPSGNESEESPSRNYPNISSTLEIETAPKSFSPRPNPGTMATESPPSWVSRSKVPVKTDFQNYMRTPEADRSESPMEMKQSSPVTEQSAADVNIKPEPVFDEEYGINMDSINKTSDCQYSSTGVPGLSLFVNQPERETTSKSLSNLPKQSCAEIAVDDNRNLSSTDKEPQLSELTGVTGRQELPAVTVIDRSTSLQTRQPQTMSVAASPHPAFCGASVLNKASSILTGICSNPENMKNLPELQQLSEVPLLNSSQDSNESMNRVLMISLREEQIRKNLGIILSHGEQCQTLLIETQKEIDYFKNLHQCLVKQEANLRQQRLDILKGAVGNANITEANLPPIFARPQPPISANTSFANLDPHSTSQDQETPNVTMEYVGTLNSANAAQELLIELSGETRSSTPQPGSFKVPQPLVSDIDDLNKSSEPKKKGEKKKKKKPRAASLDASESSSTTISVDSKKKKLKKKTKCTSKKEKGKDEESSKVTEKKQKKGGKRGKFEKVDKSTDLSSTSHSSSSISSSVATSETESTIRNFEKRIETVLSGNISESSLSDTEPLSTYRSNAALKKISNVRSIGQKEKFKAMLLESIDTTVTMSQEWKDPESLFLEKINCFQTETDSSALNTPTSIMSSNRASPHRMKDCSVRLEKLNVNNLDRTIDEVIADCSQDELPSITCKKRNKYSKRDNRSLPSICSAADSSTETIIDLTVSPTRLQNAPNRDYLVEAGVIFTNADAEEMLSDSAVIKLETDDESVVSSSDVRSLISKRSSTQGTDNYDSKGNGVATLGEFYGHSMPIFAMQVHGNFLYTCSQDVTVRKFDLESHECVMVFSGHTKPVHCLVVTSYLKSTRLFTGGFDNLLIIHDSKTGTILDKYEMDSKLYCMHEEWKQIFIGLGDGCVHCWDLKSHCVIDTFRCSDQPISAIASAKEGVRRLLLVGSFDSIITIRDANSGLLLRTLDAHEKTPLCIKINGSQVFSSSNDNTIKVHDLNTGSYIYTFNLLGGTITTLALARDHLLSCGYDGIIRCFNPKTFELIQMFYGAGKSLILDMLIHDDLIYTANRDGLVEAIQFDLENIFSCQVARCHFKFGLVSHLSYHLFKDHMPSMMSSGSFRCQWKNCECVYAVATSRANVEEHIAFHVDEYVTHC